MDPVAKGSRLDRDHCIRQINSPDIPVIGKSTGCNGVDGFARDKRRNGDRFIPAEAPYNGNGAVADRVIQCPLRVHSGGHHRGSTEAKGKQ